MDHLEKIVQSMPGRVERAVRRVIGWPVCERCGREWSGCPWPRHDDPDDRTPNGVCWDCEAEGW